MRHHDGHPEQVSELMADCLIDDYFNTDNYVERGGPALLTRYQLLSLVQIAYVAGVREGVEYQKEKQ